MKKNMMLMVAIMISTIVFAQQAHKGRKYGIEEAEKMKKELSLTDTQFASIKGIDKKYATRRWDLRKDSVTTREKKHEAVKTLRTERENEIKGVLNADQKSKWETYKTKRFERRKEYMNEAHEKHSARMKMELSLSDDQSAKIQDADKAFRTSLDALKKGQKDSKKMDKAAFKKLKDDHDATIKATLTDEQFQQWTKMKADRKSKRDHHRGHDEKKEKK